MQQVLVLLFLGLWCFATPSLAEYKIYVSPEGSETPDGTKENPYGSFSAALAGPSVKSGTYFCAMPGNYTGPDNYNLVIAPTLALAFIVDSEPVIIDFNGTMNGFLNVSSQGRPFKVQGFTFQNQAAESTTPILSFVSTEETFIASCTFQNVGFAISMVDVTEMQIEDCLFDSCISAIEQNGPGLYCRDTLGNITSTFFQNGQGGKGGAIFIDATPDGYILMDSVQILNNTAEHYGGGIYINEHANVTVSNSTIRNNTAKGHDGGGIYSQAPLSISGTDIEDNMAAGVGGGLAIETVPTSVSSVPQSTSLSSLGVNQNVATRGAGIHLASLSPVFISALIFTSNVAEIASDDDDSGKGGALYVDPSSDTVTIDGTTFASNSAAAKGGAVYIAGPSASSLVQMRTGCDVKDNVAAISGGGVELGGPILFASFSSSTFSDNVVDGGFGGGIMLGGSAVVFECIIEENSAAYGAGVAMAQAGLVSLVDSNIVTNNASQYGGGVFVSTASGLVMEGCEIAENNAIQGGGAYVTPSLPVEFSSVIFSNNQISQAGSALYISGVDQVGLNALNLVKLKNCIILDEYEEAIYSDGGEIVFQGTCAIPGMQTVDASSISLCGCQEIAVQNLKLQASSGAILTDSNVQLSEDFSWYGGIIYGVNSTSCVNGYRTGGDYSSALDSPLTISVSGIKSIIYAHDTAQSLNVDWKIMTNLDVTSGFSVGANVIYNYGRLTITESEVSCMELHNEEIGTLQLEKDSKIDGYLFQSGTMELRYNSAPEEKRDVAQVTEQEILGGTLKAIFPSSDALVEGDRFYLLKYGSNIGRFDNFELNTQIEEKTHGILEYKFETIQGEIVHGSGDSNGGLIAIIIVSIIIILAFFLGGFWAYRNREQMGDGEVWDDGAEESKILGESGGVERSLIRDSNL